MELVKPPIIRIAQLSAIWSETKVQLLAEPKFNPQAEFLQCVRDFAYFTFGHATGLFKEFRENIHFYTKKKRSNFYSKHYFLHCLKQQLEGDRIVLLLGMLCPLFIPWKYSPSWLNIRTLLYTTWPFQSEIQFGKVG